MRRPSWTTVLLSAGAALLAALVALTLYAARQQVHAYYERVLEPERLVTPVGAAPPKSFRLTDVPWFTSDLELASSVSFAMLAAQQGKDEPRQKIDFLMGTTWGATPIPRQIGFWPGQDPELGFRPAAAALGFARHSLVTDDAERYTHELKAQLAGGRAVRVAVDLVTLEKRQQEDPIAHSIVLVGYDETSFEYYEPVCRPPAPCESGSRPPGMLGQRVPAKQLLDAVDRQSLVYKYPWRYHLLVLEKAGAPSENFDEALKRNARALVGFKLDELVSGADAVEETSKAVTRAGREGFTKPLERAVRLATMVRRDDARMLSVLFPGDPRVEIAATHLERSAEAFAKAIATFDRKNNVLGLTDALSEAARADRAAGEALLGAALDGGDR